MHKALYVLAVLLTLPAGLAAQSEEIFEPQNDGWRVQLGDDTAWADPAFDDSSWTTVSLRLDGFPRQFLEGRSRWYRKRIHLPDQPGPMQLVVTTYDGSYEVYVDGRRVGPPIQPSLFWINRVTRIFPLRSAEDRARDVEVAIRSHLHQGSYFATFPPGVGVGNPAGAARFQIAADGQVFLLKFAPFAVNAIMTLAGLILLSLYWQQPGRKEYLWLGFSVLFSGLSTLVSAAQSFIPVSWNGFLGDPCEYWFFVAYIEFVYAFVGRKPPRPIRIYQWALLAIPFLLSPLGWTGAIDVNTYSWLQNGIILPGIVIPISLLVVWARRGNREAAILIVPMLLGNIGLLLYDFEVAGQYLRPSWQGFPSLQLGLVKIDLVSIAQCLFLLAIGLTIFLRFVRISRDQARTAAELDAAREIQQYLIPSRMPETPGVTIETVYQPSREVGGDFFQVLPHPSGATLIVVGDVAGKGLQAGMLAALIIGAIRMAAKFTVVPAEILVLLNERLQGRGLVTCVVLRVEPGGSAVLANAGHIPPFLNGRELAIDGSLPLGIAPDGAYCESSICLAPNDQLTFLSDGVVEARNPQGELFGFERTAAISTQSANRIAKAAELFGQEDDITVLTIQFTGSEVLLA